MDMYSEETEYDDHCRTCECIRSKNVFCPWTKEHFDKEEGSIVVENARQGEIAEGLVLMFIVMSVTIFALVARDMT